ncbi:condensation domain-containing protein, partial [Marilutibacter spongiae]
GQARSGHAPIPVVARGGVLPLSFAQQRLWFIDRLEGGSAQYNMPVALRLEGALDEAALSGALAGLVARHEILRTTYAEHEGEGVQVVHPPGPVALARHDLSDRPGPAREAAVRELAREEAGRPFDLARDRVLRGALVRLDADTHVLLLTVHHIASDGWSFGVLVREFTALYAGLAGGVAAPLAPLPVQYADYAAWQRERLQGEGLARELGYWRTQLADLP